MVPLVRRDVAHVKQPAAVLIALVAARQGVAVLVQGLDLVDEDLDGLPVGVLDETLKICLLVGQRRRVDDELVGAVHEHLRLKVLQLHLAQVHPRLHLDPDGALRNGLPV